MSSSGVLDPRVTDVIGVGRTASDSIFVQRYVSVATLHFKCYTVSYIITFRFASLLCPRSLTYFLHITEKVMGFTLLFPALVHYKILPSRVIVATRYSHRNCSTSFLNTCHLPVNSRNSDELTCSLASFLRVKFSVDSTTF